LEDTRILFTIMKSLPYHQFVMTKDNENRHLRPSSSRGSEFDSVKFGSLSSEKSADCCNSFSSRRERGFRTACENESVMSKERDALHRALENSSRNCVEEKTAATSGSTRVIRLPSKMPLFLFLIAEISQVGAFRKSNFIENMLQVHVRDSDTRREENTARQ